MSHAATAESKPAVRVRTWLAVAALVAVSSICLRFAFGDSAPELPRRATGDGDGAAVDAEQAGGVAVTTPSNAAPREKTLEPSPVASQANTPQPAVPSSILGLFRDAGYEWTGEAIDERQLGELREAGKRIGNEISSLGGKLAELSRPMVDAILASEDSVNVAMQTGVVRRVDKPGVQGDAPRPGTESLVVFRSHATTGPGYYAVWLYLDEHPTLAPHWHRREELRRELRNEVARIAGNAVRPIARR